MDVQVELNLDVSIDLSDEDVVEQTEDLRGAIHYELRDSIIKALRASPEWKEIRKTIYQAVLDQLREDVRTDFFTQQRKGE